MKITDIKTYVVEAHRRNWVFLEVETDEGLVGLGECTLEGFAKTEVACVEDYKRLLIGRNPMEIEAIWDDLYRRKFWRQDIISCTALSGIEIALWDIKGKALNVPVYELLGGACREYVRVYGNYWFMNKKMGKMSVGEYAEAAARAVENGWDALKWSPFGYPAYICTREQEHVIEECVRRVREAVGPNVELMCDAHARFNLATATSIARRLEPYNLLFFEEPIPCENVDALAELHRRTRTPLATGEHIATHYQFREILEKYAVDIIQPDLQQTGGLMVGKKIAAMAQAYYMNIIPHNCKGPVSTCAHAHFCLSTPNAQMLEYIIVPDRQDVLVEPFLPKDGKLYLSRKPGLGIELNHKALSKYPYEPRDLDHFNPEREITL